MAARWKHCDGAFGESDSTLNKGTRPSATGGSVEGTRGRRTKKYPSSEGAFPTHPRDERKCWSSCSMRADRSKQAGQDDPQPSGRDMQLHDTLRWMTLVVPFCLLLRNRHLPCCWSCKATESKGGNHSDPPSIMRCSQPVSLFLFL